VTSGRSSFPSVVRPVLQPELTQGPAIADFGTAVGGRAMARAGGVTVAGCAPSALTISFEDRSGRPQLRHPGEQIIVERHVGHPVRPTPGWRPARARGVYRHHSFGMAIYDETTW